MVLFGLGQLSPAGATEPTIDFVTQIQPILADRCISCHGPRKSKGRLRLDSADGVFRLDDIVIPGDAEESEFYYRIVLPEEDEDRMPGGKGGPLTAEQIELVRLWIDEGAPWPEGLVIPFDGPDEPEFLRGPEIVASAEEIAAIARLQEHGILVHPVALNETLTEVSLSSVGADEADQAIALLASIHSLEIVNLSGVRFEDEQLEAISELPHLVHLRLDRTQVADAGLRHLRGLENLAYLNLFDTAVTDAGLESLRELPRLKRIYVGRTQITPAGVARLRAERPEMEIVGAEEPGFSHVDSLPDGSP